MTFLFLLVCVVDPRQQLSVSPEWSGEDSKSCSTLLLLFYVLLSISKAKQNGSIFYHSLYGIAMLAAGLFFHMWITILAHLCMH